MKIQLALDLLDEVDALEAARAASPFVDIVEVGTSLLKSVGSGIVGKIRAACPGKLVFVDMKIIDGPEREAKLMARAGADMYSMLAVATDVAVRKVLAVAAENRAAVVFDMQSAPAPLARARELKALGAEWLCVHKNADCGDDQTEAFREYLDLKQATGLPVALAGGIDATTLPEIGRRLAPDVVIVGGAILHAADPATAARRLRAIADRAEAEQGAAS
jgi:3-hexulose-6-phosphate synthase